MATLTTIHDGSLELYGNDAVNAATLAWLLRYQSPKTRGAYAATHRDFVRHLHHCGVMRPADMTRAHIDVWARLLEENGYAPNSRAQKLSIVSSWCEALVDDGIIPTNPCRGVRRPHRDTLEGTTRAPSTSEVVAVLAWISERHEAVAIAIELMARHAMRIGSVMGITRGDMIVDSSGALHLRTNVKGGRLLITRIGSRLARRIVTLDADLAELHPDAAGPTTTLLRNDAGDPVTHHMVRYWLTQAGVALKLRHPLSPHQFKAWAITTALDEGMAIEDVSNFAQHRDIRTTRRYDRNRDRRLDSVTSAVADVLDGAGS